MKYLKALLLLLTINPMIQAITGGPDVPQVLSMNYSPQTISNIKNNIIGKTYAPNTLLYLATEIKNYIDGSGSPKKTKHLFDSIDQLKSDIKPESNVFNICSDLFHINIYIKDLIALGSGTPSTIWTAWFNQFLNLIATLGNVTNTVFNPNQSDVDKALTAFTDTHLIIRLKVAQQPTGSPSRQLSSYSRYPQPQ